MKISAVHLVILFSITIYINEKVNAQLSTNFYEDPRVVFKSRIFYFDGNKLVSNGANQGPESLPISGQITGNKKLDIFIKNKAGFYANGWPGGMSYNGLLSGAKGLTNNLGNRAGYNGYGSNPGFGGTDGLGELNSLTSPFDTSARGRGAFNPLSGPNVWPGAQARPTVNPLLFGGSDMNSIGSTSSPWGLNYPRNSLTSPSYGGSDMNPTIGQVGANRLLAIAGLGGRQGYMPYGSGSGFGSADATSSYAPGMNGQPRSTLMQLLYGGTDIYGLNGMMNPNKGTNFGNRPGFTASGSDMLSLNGLLNLNRGLPMNYGNRPGYYPNRAPDINGQINPYSALNNPTMNTPSGSEMYPSNMPFNMNSPLNPFNDLGNTMGNMPSYGRFPSDMYPTNSPMNINGQINPYGGLNNIFGNSPNPYIPSGSEMYPTSSPMSNYGQINPFSALNNPGTNPYIPGGAEMYPTNSPMINGQINPFGGLNNIMGNNPAFYPRGSEMYPTTNPLPMNGQVNPYSGPNNIFGNNPRLSAPGSEFPNGQLNPFGSAGGPEMYPTNNPLNPYGPSDVDPRNKPGCQMSRGPEMYIINGQIHTIPYNGLNNNNGYPPRYQGTGCPKSNEPNGQQIFNRGLNPNLGISPSLYGNNGLEPQIPNDPLQFNRGLNNSYRPGYYPNSGQDMYPPRPIHGLSSYMGHGSDYLNPNREMYGNKLPINPYLSKMLQNNDGSGAGLLNPYESI